jgi:hypothetical protein
MGRDTSASGDTAFAAAVTGSGQPDNGGTMQTSMKPLFMREGAMRFLEETVVHAMEGVLFVLLSTLFTLAGGAALFEDSLRLAGSAGMTASARGPDAPVVAERPPLQLATLQKASFVPPARR